jgi:Carboxypeptidase regulatory-like domain
MRALATGSFLIAALLLLATPAFSQPAVSGIVRDASGAVLPGVTVEATSPALIEKSRTVVTDGSGQYRIVDLEPGTYSLTFTVSGFATIKRDGIELTGAGVTTINADLRVGAVEETVTVTGATPIVDTQTSTTRQVVLSNAVLAVAPISRTYGNVLAMVPAVQSLTLDPNSTQSLTGTATNFFFTSRGGRGNEGTVHGGRHERRVGVRRRRRLELCLRFRERAGGPGYRRQRHGRDRPRRAGIQHHPQDGRQHVRRHRIRQYGRQVVARE